MATQTLSGPNRPTYQPKHESEITPIDELPFICRPGPGRHSNKPESSNWAVPPANDYGAACNIGREYAAHFVQYLKENPSMAGSNLLGHIASDIDFTDESDAKGYWVGFFSYIEGLLYAQAKQMNLFSDVDRLKSESDERIAALYGRQSLT